jgi:tRNA pseudouridine(38-40) synthase
VRRNIKLVISYDGTDFAGWQIQSSDRSVQGELTKALSDLHQETVSITGAGRTDSGVHAVGQVGNFYTEKETIPGWKQDITGLTDYADLPQIAKNYLDRISEILGVPISIVSVGPGREQTIIV